MNTKIFQLFQEKINFFFKNPKFQEKINVTPNTILNELPWTPVKYEKFISSISAELQIPSEFITDRHNLSMEILIKQLDDIYTGRFFGEVWRPSTDSHKFSGWELVDEINKLNPTAVLDYGCGYNQFKGKIQNLIGIDPYNINADYMVDIRDFVSTKKFDVVLVLGSLNFNSEDELTEKFDMLINVLAPSGKMFIRANPGYQWPGLGKYVDIFPWSFKFAIKLAEQHGLTVESFKKDPGKNGERLFIVLSR